MYMFMPYAMEYNDEVYSIAGEDANAYNPPSGTHETLEAAKKERLEYIQKHIAGETLEYFTYDEIAPEIREYVRDIGGKVQDYDTEIPKNITLEQTEKLVKIMNDYFPFFPIDGQVIKLEETRIKVEEKKDIPLSTEIDKFNKFKEDLSVRVEDGLWGIFEEVFEIADDIESFAFTAYTPYFMDGEVCEYAINEIYYVNEEYYEDWDWYNYKEYFKETASPNMKALKLANDLIAKLPEDIIKMSFGDHKIITVHVDGSVEIDEYNHD